MLILYQGLVCVHSMIVLEADCSHQKFEPLDARLLYLRINVLSMLASFEEFFLLEANNDFVWETKWADPIPNFEGSIKCLKGKFAYCHECARIALPTLLNYGCLNHVGASGTAGESEPPYVSIACQVMYMYIPPPNPPDYCPAP